MNEELEKLQSLGAQKIYENTHIPIHHVQAMLHNNFDGFSKVQFVGFISILEREYHQKLPLLKASGLAFFQERDGDSGQETLFIVSKKKKSPKVLFLSILALVFVLAVLFQLGVFSESQKTESSIDDTLIQNAEDSIVVSENNLSDMNETNVSVSPSVAVEDVNKTDKKPVVEKFVAQSFKIKPRSKVWLGYIDVKTNKKHQKTFSSELDLDPTKEWLLFFGHGYIDMYVDNELIKFDSHEFKRFLYKDGTLQTITTKEFKKLNRGRKW